MAVRFLYRLFPTIGLICFLRSLSHHSFVWWVNFLPTRDLSAEWFRLRPSPSRPSAVRGTLLVERTIDYFTPDEKSYSAVLPGWGYRVWGGESRTKVSTPSQQLDSKPPQPLVCHCHRKVPTYLFSTIQVSEFMTRLDFSLLDGSTLFCTFLEFIYNVSLSPVRRFRHMTP